MSAVKIPQQRQHETRDRSADGSWDASGTSATWHRSTVAVATLTGVAVFATFPPLGLWPLAWIAPAGWVWLVRRRLAGRRPYAALWIAGFVFSALNWHWIALPHWSAALGLVALAGYLGVYLPVFIGLARVAVHRLRVPVIVAAPVVWTGLELAKGHLLTGFSMGLLGHTQYRWLELIQISDLVGAYGVSFAVMLVAACAARAMPIDGARRAWWPVVPAVGVVSAMLIYGYVRRSDADREPAITVALVQGSVDTVFGREREETDQEIAAEYFEPTIELADRRDDLDLIVWPETIFPRRLVTFVADAQPPEDIELSPEEFIDKLARLKTGYEEYVRDFGRRLGVPLLMGTAAEHYGPGKWIDSFNAALLVGRDGRIAYDARYDKIHPVMFGEYVPLGEVFPWLYDLTPMSGGLTPGTRPVSLEVGPLRLAPSICFETTVPHLIRRQVVQLRSEGREPDVLVNLTNDGWFWGSSELDMHLACGVFRAVECRKPLLVAANTGFSASIDGDGRILQQGPRRDVAVIVAKVAADPRDSVYLRCGDLPAGLCLAACVALAAVGLLGRFAARASRS